MKEKHGCGDVGCNVMELLSLQGDLIIRLFGGLFGDEAKLQVLLFDLDGSQEDQIQLLMDLYEHDEVPNQKPDGLKSSIWEMLQLERDVETHSFVMARVSAMLGMVLNLESHHFLCMNEVFKSLLAYGQSNMMLGSALTLSGAHWSKDSIRSNALRAVGEKLANDPKQKDKATVRECWDDWQKQPTRYRSKAAFARDMREKFPRLESQPVIERWCREWESSEGINQAK